MKRCLGLILLLTAFGCKNTGVGEVCRPDNPCPPPSCEPVPCPPAEAPIEQPCPKPQVQVKAPPPVTVKVPPPTVVVKQQPAPIQAAAVQPVYPPGPSQAAAAAMAPAPVMMQAAAAPAYHTVTSSVQTTSPPRARLGLVLDFIEIPLPILRLTALPGPQRTVVETESSAVPAPSVAFQPAVVAPPAMMAAQPIVAAQPAVAAQPVVAVQPATAPPPAAAASNVTHVCVPVQTDPASPPGTGTTTGAASQPVTKATLDELTRQLEAVQKMLDERKKQAGAGTSPLKP